MTPGEIGALHPGGLRLHQLETPDDPGFSHFRRVHTRSSFELAQLPNQ